MTISHAITGRGKGRKGGLAVKVASWTCPSNSTWRSVAGCGDPAVLQTSKHNPLTALFYPLCLINPLVNMLCNCMRLMHYFQPKSLLLLHLLGGSFLSYLNVFHTSWLLDCNFPQPRHQLYHIILYCIVSRDIVWRCVQLFSESIFM